MARSDFSRSNGGRAIRLGLGIAAVLCFGAAPAAGQQPPEAATGLQAVQPAATAQKQMAAAANPLAARAGLKILRDGGSAVDAAIAMQMVLTLVEPQSSGIGGGAFVLHWDGQRVQAYDGRETAAMAATEDHFIGRVWEAARAAGGADAFYRGPIAAALVRAARSEPHHSGRITEADLAGYRAREREPVCAPYRSWTVCGMPLPSSGGIVTAQILGILSHFELEPLRPRQRGPDLMLQPEAIHLISEAERLAFADRNLYLADPEFVRVDAAALLDPGYLAGRAGRIGERSMGHAEPGPSREPGARLAPDSSPPRPATSHLSAVDAWGHAVAMTTSIEDGFGSRIFVRGFLLNNQLTDFSFRPRAPDPDGQVAAGGAPIANRVQPGKRPLSSMSPTLVFDRGGSQLVASLGSPGGTWITSYLVKTLVGLLDWQLDAQQAIALPNFGSRNGPTALEADRFEPCVVQALRARGHAVVQIPMTSGLHAIAHSRPASPRSAIRWIGGADRWRGRMPVGASGAV